MYTPRIKVKGKKFVPSTNLVDKKWYFNTEILLLSDFKICFVIKKY